MRLVDYAFMAIGIVALSLSFRFLSSTSPEAGGLTLVRADAHKAARRSTRR